MCHVVLIALTFSKCSISEYREKAERIEGPVIYEAQRLKPSAPLSGRLLASGVLELDCYRIAPADGIAVRIVAKVVGRFRLSAG